MMAIMISRHVKYVEPVINEIREHLLLYIEKFDSFAEQIVAPNG